MTLPPPSNEDSARNRVVAELMIVKVHLYYYNPQENLHKSHLDAGILDKQSQPLQRYTLERQRGRLKVVYSSKGLFVLYHIHLKSSHQYLKHVLQRWTAYVARLRLTTLSFCLQSSSNPGNVNTSIVYGNGWFYKWNACCFNIADSLC